MLEIDPQDRPKLDARYVCPKCSHHVNLEMDRCFHCALIFTEDQRAEIAAKPETGPELNLKQPVLFILLMAVFGAIYMWGSGAFEI